MIVERKNKTQKPTHADGINGFHKNDDYDRQCQLYIPHIITRWPSYLQYYEKGCWQ